MNKFNQIVLMTALVSSAANAANVDIDGNATLGLMYTVTETPMHSALNIAWGNHLNNLS